MKRSFAQTKRKKIGPNRTPVDSVFFFFSFKNILFLSDSLRSDTGTHTKYLNVSIYRWLLDYSQPVPPLQRPINNTYLTMPHANHPHILSFINTRLVPRQKPKQRILDQRAIDAKTKQINVQLIFSSFLVRRQRRAVSQTCGGFLGFRGDLSYQILLLLFQVRFWAPIICIMTCVIGKSTLIVEYIKYSNLQQLFV